MRTWITKWGRRAAAITRSLPGLLAIGTALLIGATPIVVSGLAEIGATLGVNVDSWVETITRWSATVAGIALMAGNVYRRVTDVGKELYGLDPVATITTALRPEGPGGP